MQMTIIYDNDAWLPDLKPDWGFSCLVQGGKLPTILFDTGADGRILLANMDKLGIDPLSVDVVFISHGHFDHTGGFSDFLSINSDVTVYVPSSWQRVHGAREVVPVREPMAIAEGLFSTGELRSIEQSMVIGTERGAVIITGCSHPGVDRILQASAAWGEPFALIGGLHGFRHFELLQPLSLICPTHCTMYKKDLAAMYPGKCVSGGAGKRIEC
jgi:7,8-dihydropterin-6-yl-methyl-4-(beta-D-ribofuranosyl)aminobenzene 5'-phosphate synthase